MNNIKSRHKIYRLPIIGPLIVAIVMMVVHNLISSAVAYIVNGILYSNPAVGQIVGTIIASVALILFYHILHRRFEGFLVGGKMGVGFKMALIIPIYLGLSILFNIVMGEHISFSGITLGVIATSLAAGCAEELVFRGYIVSTLMEDHKDDQNYMSVAITSAIVFALIHLVNIAAGANIARTITQVINAFFIGFFFAVMYLRSGNLLPCIIGHTFNDIIAIGLSTDVTEAGVIRGGITPETIFNMLLCVALGIVAYNILNSGKVDEMRTLWHAKWNN